MTCKWAYLAHENRYEPNYFRAVGLGEIAEENFRRIGQNVCQIGSSIGNGLTEKEIYFDLKKFKIDLIFFF